MTRNAASLRVVDLNGGFGPNLILFDVEEVDIVGGHMNNGEGQHGVCHLTMEPLRLVEGQELEFGSDIPHEVAAHG